MSAPRPCAILGAGGYIGQQFVRMLADHPDFAVGGLYGGPRSAGGRLSEHWRISPEPPGGFGDARLLAPSAAQIANSGVELVFSALPSGKAGRFENELRRRGVHVFTNAADNREAPGVPLLVPEVNPPRLDTPTARGGALLVANPNCTTAGLVVGLAPVWARLQPRRLFVTTYQARSGAGFPGLDEPSYTDNVVPFIEDEEEKVARETVRILGADARAGRRKAPVEVLAQCARVPVPDGHLEAVTLEAARSASVEELTEAFRRFDPLRSEALPSAPHPPVHLRREADRPQPARDLWAGSPARARGMAVTVGRMRWRAPYLSLYLLSHNAVRGGAGGSVLNAELAERRGWMDRGMRAGR